MEVSGAVEGEAEWPSNLKPVAWHRDSEMVRMKLGLYHSRDNVADGEVEYRDISIEGPNGKSESDVERRHSPVDITADIVSRAPSQRKCALLIMLPNSRHPSYKRV